MNIIEIAGLDTCYRVYQTNAGLYVRVKVWLRDNLVARDVKRFWIEAEVCDVNGIGTGQTIQKTGFTMDVTVAAKPTFRDEAGLPETTGAVAGELVRVVDRLYQCDGVGGAWIDRGPITSTAPEALAEYVAWWDQIAREEVDKVELAHDRLSVESDVNALLGV